MMNKLNKSTELFNKLLDEMSDDEFLKTHNELLNQKHSGFIDLEEISFCNHPQHNPPTHIVVPKGKAYYHYCPACGSKTVIYSREVYC